MGIFNEIAVKIINAQAQIIGPLAWDEAKKVSGLKVLNSEKGEVDFDRNDEEGRKTTIDSLVKQYEQLFGQIADEVCKEATASLVADLPPTEIPSTLK